MKHGSLDRELPRPIAKLTFTPLSVEIQILGRRDTSRRLMAWSESITVTATEAEVIQYLGLLCSTGKVSQSSEP